VDSILLGYGVLSLGIWIAMKETQNVMRMEERREDKKRRDRKRK
jgi:hypothetical protein